MGADSRESVLWGCPEVARILDEPNSDCELGPSKDLSTG